MERKITIEEAVVYREDYQMRMLRANEIEGLLPVRGRGADGSSFYDYNVSGKMSMQAMYEKGKISSDDLRKFLKRFLAVIREVEAHLLCIHRILLEPEYIFYGEETFWFCYCPLAKQELWEEFHRLTDYFVRQTDCKDKACVRMTFLLHKETMAENYDMEGVVKEALREGEKGNEEARDRSVSELDGCVALERPQRSTCEQAGRRICTEPAEYDRSQHDWIRAQKEGSLVMEETENLWTPVKRFLTRHKKPRWGDWDGLYIEEEEL